MIRKEVLISKTAVALWLINPLLSLFYSLRHIRDPKVFPTLLLFSFFFGLTFVVPEDQEGAADSARYAAELKELHRQPMDFQDIVNYLYNADSGKLDVYQPVVTWLLSYFTDNPQWLFALFASVFGWFWFRNIQLVVRLLPAHTNGLLLLLLVLFAMISPIWEINGVRMWTAAQIFVHGLLLIFLMEEKKGYIYCIAALFVHFSFSLLLALLLVYRFLPKQTDVLFVAYVVSLFVRELNIEVIQQYLDMLPDFMQTRKGYVSDASIEEFKEIQATGGGLSWHVLLAEGIQRYLFLLLSLLLYLGIRFRPAEQTLFVRRIFNAGLFLSAFANIAANLPSGSRFAVIAQSVMLAGFLLFYGQLGWQSFWQRNILRAAAPFLIFLLLFKLRTGFDFISLTTVLGNPFIALLVTDNVPLMELFKSLL
ncbi:EpsG family protein [Rhodoflexus caldus]|uniref:EpsG family protein n=1 Tax=Rhodoflexus caldus TaxID=2891236 RepID=UPI00202A8A25|nr:EpsG family protein [Rhodoflexus caldus]